ncbi:MAG: hypothetical protein MZV65_15160 [Chromatiales bacterium]|nr:hypothetical protein [Chromatiales bacterium]
MDGTAAIEVEAEWDPPHRARRGDGGRAAIRTLPRKGDVIDGLPRARRGAGRRREAVPRRDGRRRRDGQIVTHGGRVLCATALGNTVAEAQNRAYNLAKRVRWDGVYYRTDVGYRAIAREPGE